MSFDAQAVRARREAMLLRLLFRATHTMNADLVARLTARGHDAVVPSFIGLLAHIDTEGTSLSEVARRAGVSRQAVSQIVRSIEAAGIVERRPNPHDRRSVLIRHTAAGRRLLLDAIEEMTAIERRYEEAVGALAVAETKRLLTDLLAAIDPDGAF